MHKRSFVRIFILVAVAAFADESVVFAQWSTNPNFNNPISIGTGNQLSAASVSDGAGGAIITWYDARSGIYDIYTQRINASGVVQWTANGVAICTAADQQSNPTITSDNAGGAIITWEDLRSGTNNDIYAQRINAGGVVQWTANGVAICAAIATQSTPTITSDNAGGAIITWQDFRSGNFDIYAQRINASGVVQWTAQGVAICIAANAQSNTTITTDNASGAVITWEDERNGVANDDIFAQRINASGVVQWAANGVAICTAVLLQNSPTITGDNAGGAIINWQDGRGGGANFDIYTQRINAGGVVQWTAQGVAICIAANDQSNTTITADNTGGAIITWNDFRSGTNYDIYAQRINASGVVQWTADGVAICTAANTQSSPTITSDPATGGTIITWQDTRSVAFSNDIYAQRINAGGVVQWAPDGVAICTASGNQQRVTIIGDGAGGAIIAWEDFRSGTTYDIYAQKVDYYGYLGNAAPQIADVVDVINDQGGKLKATWNASYLDDLMNATITDYLVFRGVRSSPNRAAALSSDEFMARLSRKEDMKGAVMAEPLNNSPEIIYYELIATVTAQQLPGYSYFVPTVNDSGPQGIPWYFVMIRARTATPLVYWNSDPDSAYSKDNLPPGAPTGPMASILSSTSARTHWNPNTSDPDVGYYKVYRSTTQNFVISPANFIGTVNDTIFTDAGLTAGTTYWYRVTTVDVHGNESTPTASFTPDKIKASLRAYLQGPFNTGTGMMNTTLNSGGYLAARFTTVAIPSLAVDSVSVEMRNNASAAASTVRKFRPAWLMNDGTMRSFFDTTKTYVEFDTLNGSYYLVVYHRNHLPVMTAAVQAVNYSAPVAPYNFTTAQTQAFGTNPMNPVGSVFAMVSGDASGNGQVANSDINSVIRPALGQSGYKNGDINLNGQVATSDINTFTRPNIGRGTQVPSIPLPLPILEEEK